MEAILTDENFKKEVLESEVPCLVDFWAPWCGPCRMISPLVKEIAEKFKGKLKVGKLNVDESPKTAYRYGITSIPMLSLFKNGKPVTAVIGAVPKKEIMSKLNPYLI